MVYIFIWVCQPTGPQVCSVLCVCVCVCVCLCMCDIKSEYQQKSIVCVRPRQTWHQDHFGTKVPRLNMCGSIISLSKIAHQMWCNHPFSQRNKTIERAVGGGGWRRQERKEEGGGGGMDKIWKRGGGNMRGST